jgi:hypothetical protein
MGRYTSFTGVAFLLLIFAACGSGSRTSAPTTPTPTPAANQAPQISSVTVTPAIGVTGLTTLTAHVEANDPDGDPLTYAWVAGGLPLGTNSTDVTFKAGETRPPVSVTVSDSKGAAAASGKLQFATVDVRPLLDGYFDADAGIDFTLRLNLAGTALTGDILLHRNDHRGLVDPAEPGRIDAAGNFRIRFKVQSEGDMILAGRFEPGTQSRFEPTPDGQGFLGKGHVEGGPLDGHGFTIGMHSLF